MHSDSHDKQVTSQGIDLQVTSIEYPEFPFLDAAKLEVAVAQAATKLLNSLVGKETSLSATIPLAIQEGEMPETIGQLRHIQLKFEAFQQASTALYLGYPIVNISSEKGSLMHCPVFIWPVELLLMPDVNRLWKLDSPDLNAVQVHPLLLNYLQNRQPDADIPLAPPEQLTQESIHQFCHDLATMLQVEFDENSSLNAYDVEDYQLQGRISKSILIGSFVQEDMQLLADAGATSQENITNNSPSKSWTYSVAANRLNTIQNAAANALFKGNDIAVTGPASSGKTQLIASIVPALLSAGKSLLYVCSDPQQSDDLLQTLNTMGLHAVGFINLTQHSDSNAVLEFMNTLKKTSKKGTAFNQLDFRQEMHQFNRLSQRLEAVVKASKSLVFDKLNWSEIIGNYLLAEHQFSRHLLQTQLQADDFEFTPEEFFQIEKELQEHFKLFHKIKTLEHPFECLNSRFIQSEESYESIKEQVKIHLHLYKQKFTQLFQSIHRAKEANTDQKAFGVYDFAHSMLDAIDVLMDEMQLLQQLYGEDFNKLGNLQDAKLKLLAVFSKKYKSVLKVKKQIKEQCKKLEEQFVKEPLYTAAKPVLTEANTMVQLHQNLEHLQQQLNAWPSTVLTQAKRDDTEGQHKLVTKDNKATTELFDNCIKTIEQFNKDNWFSKAIDIPSLQPDNVVEQLQTILYKIQLMEDHWSDYEAFYLWKKSWFALSEPSQHLIKALIATYSDNWDAGFKSWYYHHLIHQFYLHQLKGLKFNFSDALEHYGTLLETIQSKLVQKALHQYFKNIKEELKIIKKEKALSLNKVATAFKGQTVYEVLKWLGKKHSSSIFPLMIVHPEQLDEVAQLGMEFDLMVTDNVAIHQMEAVLPLASMATQHCYCLNLDEKDAADRVVLDNLFSSKEGFAHFHLPALHSSDNNSNSELKSDISQLHLGIKQYLLEFFGEERLMFASPVEGILYDIVVSPKQQERSQQPFVILCDRGIHLHDSVDFQQQADALFMLQNKQYAHYLIDSAAWWKDSHKELQQLLLPLLEWDRLS